LPVLSEEQAHSLLLPGDSEGRCNPPAWHFEIRCNPPLLRTWDFGIRRSPLLLRTWDFGIRRSPLLLRTWDFEAQRHSPGDHSPVAGFEGRNRVLAAAGDFEPCTLRPEGCVGPWLREWG
jgi:hypothetical protein